MEQVQKTRVCLKRHTHRFLLLRLRFVYFVNCVCLPDGSENVTSLDLSDFPALADRSRRDGGSNPTPLPNPLAGRAPYGEEMSIRALELLLLLSRIYSWTFYSAVPFIFPVGMVTKPSSEQSQDFSIHNEDFPALPGPNYQIKDPTSSSEDNKTVSLLHYMLSPCHHGYLCLVRLLCCSTCCCLQNSLFSVSVKSESEFIRKAHLQLRRAKVSG